MSTFIKYLEEIYCVLGVACILLSLLFFAGCNKSSTGSGTSDSANGVVSLSVVGSTERSSSVLIGKIDHFVITLSGEEVTPVEKEIPNTAQDVEIDGAPVGPALQISVTALNVDKLIIREGVSDKFSLSNGETKAVTVQLHAIPIFVNVHDGNIVNSKSTVFEILSDPGEALTVEDVTSGSDSQSLVSLSTGTSQISADSSSGFGNFNPSNLSVGNRTFVAKSLVTQASSTVHLIVVDGTVRKPAPLFSAGNNHSKTRVGQFFGRSTTSQNDKLGELWPNIIIQELSKGGI